MAGFLKPTSGEIKIENQIVQKPSMKYVTIFQNYGLLPWRTVQKNVELGLETQKYSKEKKAKIASHYLKMVGLEHAAKNVRHSFPVVCSNVSQLPVPLP